MNDELNELEALIVLYGGEDLIQKSARLIEHMRMSWKFTSDLVDTYHGGRPWGRTKEPGMNT